MIYICVPAHNEERTIGVLLWKIRKVMAEFGRDYEILVLDDGSTDDTWEVLQPYRRVLPLVLFREDERRGYRAAVERLLREASERAPYPKRDAAVVLQGDFTESPEEIVPLVKTFEGGVDVVASSTRAGDAPRPVRWMRRAAPFVLGRTWRRAPVSDPLSGLRAYRIVVLKKALRELGDEPLLTREGWGANVELLRRVAPHARRIEEEALNVQYGIRQRETRVRMGATLRDLMAVRGLDWSGPEAGGDTDAQ